MPRDHAPPPGEPCCDYNPSAWSAPGKKVGSRTSLSNVSTTTYTDDTNAARVRYCRRQPGARRNVHASEHDRMLDPEQLREWCGDGGGHDVGCEGISSLLVGVTDWP